MSDSNGCDYNGKYKYIRKLSKFELEVYREAEELLQIARDNLTKGLRQRERIIKTFAEAYDINYSDLDHYQIDLRSGIFTKNRFWYEHLRENYRDRNEKKI